MKCWGNTFVGRHQLLACPTVSSLSLALPFYAGLPEPTYDDILAILKGLLDDHPDFGR